MSGWICNFTMTDNGSAFVSNVFAEACGDLGLRHI
jgi:hypothetical protein